MMFIYNHPPLEYSSNPHCLVISLVKSDFEKSNHDPGQKMKK